MLVCVHDLTLIISDRSQNVLHCAYLNICLVLQEGTNEMICLVKVCQTGVYGNTAGFFWDFNALKSYEENIL